MTRQALGFASIILVLAMLAAGLAVGSMLPQGALLPMHWGLDGQPDRLADKWTALMMPPLIAAATSLFFYAVPGLEPREAGLSRSQGLYRWSWAAMLLVFGFVELAVLSAALGWGMPVIHLILAALGLALILIGNQLAKSRRMFLIGVRTPWTLASEEVWIKTHRLAGKLMVAAGAIVILATLLALAPEQLAWITLCSVAAAAIVPAAYSYILWREEKRQVQRSE